MIIIYGLRKKMKIDKPLGNQVCPNCGHTVNMQLAHEYSYPHIFYIPVGYIPGIKITLCSNCGVSQVLTSAQFKQLKSGNP